MCADEGVVKELGGRGFGIIEMIDLKGVLFHG
jgi:hypothetical protein